MFIFISSILISIDIILSSSIINVIWTIGYLRQCIFGIKVLKAADFSGFCQGAVACSPIAVS